MARAAHAAVPHAHRRRHRACDLGARVLTAAAHAATIEKLIMPGPVSKAHAKIEGECSNCHDRANRERQTALCLDCHKDTAADISSRSRYHGRMPEAATGQ